MALGSVLALAGLLLATGSAVTKKSAGSVSPVQKVIELLEENKLKVTRDLAAEEKEMAEYASFCDSESSEKGYAISTAERKIADLKAAIEEAEAKLPAQQDEVASMGSDVAGKEADLYKASELRKKEKADFMDTEKELVTSVDQLDRALVIIKRSTSFAQGKPESQKALKNALSAIGKVLDAGRVSASTRKVLKDLMQTGVTAGAAASNGADDYQKLSQPQAKVSAYESSSGGIVDKIAEMKEKAEETLSGARRAETNAGHDFNMMSQSMTDGIKVLNEKISYSKSMIATMTEEMAKAKGSLGETEKSKADDEAYLKTLGQECRETAANWAERQESAHGEIAAINKAIEILSQGVRTFLQVDTKSKGMRGDVDQDADEDADAAQVPTPEVKMRSHLIAKLKDMSKQFGSYALMEMAGAAAADPFGKIKGLIEEMIAKLVKEANEEATQKAFCDEEMSKSTKTKEEKTMTADKLQNRMDGASAKKAQLEQSIKDLEAEIAALDKSTAEATTLRNEEHTTYLKASKDFKDAADAVEGAIKVLKEYYEGQSLLQTGSKKSSQPEFGGAKSDAASSIISILEMCGEDFTKLHSEVEAGEAEAVDAYEKLMNENKVSKAAKTTEVKASASEIKSLVTALANTKEDHDMTSKELDAVMMYIEKLKPQCEEKAMSYAEKKARRESEISGLKEALSILTGDTVALVQSRSKLRGVAPHA